MNDLLHMQFPGAYRMVRYDNKGSVNAGSRLEQYGVPLSFAIAELRKQCVVFNPSKHGGGELPGTLAYFAGGIMKAWDRREQTSLRLLSVQPGERIPREHATVQAPEPERRSPTPETTKQLLAVMREEFERRASGGEGRS